MIEYRYGLLSEETLEKLYDMGIYPIEEDFKKEEKQYVVYYDETLPELVPEKYISCKDVDETGWDVKWKDYIKPGFLTETIRFEFDTDISPDENTIIINPSMAFGTGTHPTTKCAAKLLEKVAKGRIVVDAGCGSGILAITASVRGAEKVYAFDIDPSALPNTYENIALNNIRNISAWAGGVESFCGKADVFTANIITSVLKIIHPYVMSIRPEYIVYSGILISEYDEFMKDIDTEGYSVVETTENEEWKGVMLKCL